MHYWPEVIIAVVLWLVALYGLRYTLQYDRHHARRMREAQRPRRIRATYGPGYGLLGWDVDEEL